MEIKSIKKQGAGYLVNGTMSVPKTDENRHYQAILKAIEEGTEVEPEFTSEEITATATANVLTKKKIDRTNAVNNIVVEITTEANEVVKLDGDEESQNRMARTIKALEYLPVEQQVINWKAYDNKFYNLTPVDLAAGLVAAGTKQSELWATYG